MKRIVSILVIMVMLVSCMIVFGICADAANEPAVTKVDNYTVTIEGITNIKEIRYAIGHYTKGDQVRNAEKNQTLSAALVSGYTVDGVMTYEVPWVGEYTFWVRLNDGSQYFIYADVTEIDPYVESDGLRLTVKDFGENYKDMWIAEGTWNSYSEIKNQATIKYQAAAAKLSNYFANHDFTYVTANPGEHTVLIRYNDGTQDVIHTELTVDVPTFDVNGLQVTVSNIPGIKIIRTAYGEYNSVAEIKGAKGVRNFNNKTAIKDAESYKIQYRDNGTVTIIVEYTTGYKHVEHVEIEQKQSTVENTAEGLRFGNLDGFVMIRYAKGEYSTSNQIKNAKGSKVLKADAVVDGYITVSGLTVGETYTFCVQFEDESYNYYVITVTEAEPDVPAEPEITAPTFIVSDAAAKAGENVDLTIAVKNNPGISSIGMHVSFDKALTLNSVNYNSDIGGMPYQPQSKESPVKLVWVSPYANVEGDWTFVTLNFTVASDASAGAHSVSVSYDAEDVYDMTESNVAFDVINGAVTVTK